MRFVLFVLLLLSTLLVGCSDEERVALAELAGCTMSATDGGYWIQCQGQERVFIANGQNGVAGRDGIDGEDGKDGQDGKDGKDGLDGENGADGKNGHASVIAQTDSGEACAAGGVTILTALDVNDNLTLDTSDANLQSATLCNGTNAPVAPFTTVGIVDPCGTRPGIHNEVFLRLANQSLLASFSDDVGGTNTRFAYLTEGCYVTTDGDRCSFCVNAAKQIVNESHHY